MAINKGDNTFAPVAGVGITTGRMREMIATEVRHAIREAVPEVITAVREEVVAMVKAARRQKLELEKPSRKRKAAQTVTPESVVPGKRKFAFSRASSESGGFKPKKTGGKWTDRCFKCGQSGHFSKDCKSPLMVCFVCNQADHMKANCPKRRTADGEEVHAAPKLATGAFSVNSVPALAMLDAGPPLYFSCFTLLVNLRVV